jgi:hypothetical protein
MEVFMGLPGVYLVSKMESQKLELFAYVEASRLILQLLNSCNS